MKEPYKTIAIAGCLGALGYALTRGSMSAVTRYSYGSEKPRITAKGEVDRDPAKLLPAFADRLEIVFREMRKLGWKPVLWEGWRSRERALALSKTGKGIKDSMHFYGGAADIIDEDYLWSNQRFFDDLAKVVRAAGLYSGADFVNDDPDWPHVQAVKGGTVENRFKKMATAVERNNYLIRQWAA